MDAVLGIFEDEQFRDEPLSGESNDPDDYEYLDHIYTWDLPETRTIALAEFYETVKVSAEVLKQSRTCYSIYTYF